MLRAGRAIGSFGLSYVKIPTASIIDGVDVLASAGVGKYKRLPSSVDAGFTYVNELGKSNYSGKSVRRKVAGNPLAD